MGHRYYDPTLGRFTQPDPSGQETNPYLYAGGDPINQTDPGGLGLMDALGPSETPLQVSLISPRAILGRCGVT
ncbi:RHS repeat-associated core domain-containing protein [Streptomyces sp. NPDC054808]